MNFLTHPLILAWFLTVAAKIVLLVLLWRRGMARRYAGLAGYLTGTVALSLYRLYCGMQSETGYYDSYLATQQISLLLYAGLVLDVYRAMARRFPHVVPFASALALVYGAFAVFAAWFMSGLGIPFGAPWAAAVATTRNVTLAGAVFLALSRLWWFSSPHGTPFNVRCYANGASLLVAGHIVGAILFAIHGPIAAINYVLYWFTLLAVILWGDIQEGGEDWKLQPVDPRAGEMLDNLARRAREI